MSFPIDRKHFVTITTHTLCNEGFQYQLIFNIKIWSRIHANTNAEREPRDIFKVYQATPNAD